MSETNASSDAIADLGQAGFAASLPLTGVTVVELGQNLAGPFCGQIFASLGADVVKIEKPTGDDSRGWGPPFVHGTSSVFQAFNRNKRSISINLNDPEKREWLAQFIGSRDIFIHNMRPGALEPMGLDGPTLVKRFPRLVHGSISGFGANGPLKDRPGYDSIVQAVAGIFSINGDPNGPPARVGLSVLDLGTGLWLGLSTLAALRRRDLTGQGSEISASLYETAVNWLAVFIGVASCTGKQPPRDRAGSPTIATYECYPTQDGEILIAAANDNLFRKMCHAIGRGEWATDERFATNALRLNHKQYLTSELGAILRTNAAAEWDAVFSAAGVPVARINTIAQMIAHPQTAALDILESIPDSPLLVPRLPVSFNRVRPSLQGLSPALGAHNEEFLSRG